jgi:hypothetical protein
VLYGVSLPRMTQRCVSFPSPIARLPVPPYPPPRTPVPPIGQVYSVSCGRSFSACITNEGDLFAWGRNLHGECAQGRVKAPGVATLLYNGPYPPPTPRLTLAPARLQSTRTLSCPLSRPVPCTTVGASWRQLVLACSTLLFLRPRPCRPCPFNPPRTPPRGCSSCPALPCPALPLPPVPLTPRILCSKPPSTWTPPPSAPPFPLRAPCFFRHASAHPGALPHCPGGRGGLHAPGGPRAAPGRGGRLLQRQRGRGRGRGLG